MKKFLFVKIWIALEIVALLVLGVLAVLKTFAWKQEQGEVTYRIPEETVQEVSFSDIELPRDLSVDEYEEEDQAAEGDLTGETLTGSVFKMDYPQEVLDKLSEMTEEQKIEMLLLTTPEALCEKTKVTVAGDIFANAFSEKRVSGLIFTDQNFVTDGAGMEMLKKIRGWSRESTGMTIFLGYRPGKAPLDAKALSERGFNMIFTDPKEQDLSDLLQNAADALMIPASVIGSEEADQLDERIMRIVKPADAAEVTEAYNQGRSFLIETDDVMTMKNALLQASESGDLLPEALDQAAGYALSLRMGLTAMRPEETEKEPPKAAPAKKTTKQKTPEEQAKEAAEQLAKQAEKEAKKAQEAAKKQAEELQKLQQKQLEEMAAAAAAAAAQPQGQ